LLEKHFNNIAGNTAKTRKFSDFLPEVLVNKREHHYIFFTHPRGQKPRIFAVLHDHMNLVTRLEKRLKP
jgi:plasmid stabilization system protein ParE